MQQALCGSQRHSSAQLQVELLLVGYGGASLAELEVGLEWAVTSQICHLAYQCIDLELHVHVFAPNTVPGHCLLTLAFFTFFVFSCCLQQSFHYTYHKPPGSDSSTFRIDTFGACTNPFVPHYPLPDPSSSPLDRITGLTIYPNTTAYLVLAFVLLPLPSLWFVLTFASRRALASQRKLIKNALIKDANTTALCVIPIFNSSKN